MGKRGDVLERSAALPTLYAIRTQIRREAARLPLRKGDGRDARWAQLQYRADAVDDAIMQLRAQDLEGFGVKLKLALEWLRAEYPPAELAAGDDWGLRILRSIEDDLPMLEACRRRLDGLEFRALTEGRAA